MNNLLRNSHFNKFLLNGKISDYVKIKIYKMNFKILVKQSLSTKIE